MRSLILAAALAVTAMVGIAQAQYTQCNQTCTPNGMGGYNCTTTCY